MKVGRRRVTKKEKRKSEGESNEWEKSRKVNENMMVTFFNICMRFPVCSYPNQIA